MHNETEADVRASEIMRLREQRFRSSPDRISKNKDKNLIEVSTTVDDLKNVLRYLLYYL